MPSASSPAPPSSEHPLRTFVVHDAFGLENLVETQRPRAPIGESDVRIRMLANSLNYRDLLMAQGQYNPRQPLPLVPLSDGVGRIIEVGAKVTSRALGDRVVGRFAQNYAAPPLKRRTLKTTLGGPIDGMLQEEIVLPASGTALVPTHLSDEEAACLPCAALTAYAALTSFAPITAGSTVLTLGTGGVSLCALLFAKALGARVIVTSSSDEKRARAEALGADLTLNYRTDAKWGKTARAWAGGDGVDLVVEVGGAGTLVQSVQAVRPDGLVALIGVLSGGDPSGALLSALMHQVRIQGVFVGHDAAFDAMSTLIAAHKLRPPVGVVFPVDQVQDAFSLLAAGGHFGKIVLKWPA